VQSALVSVVSYSVFDSVWFEFVVLSRAWFAARTEAVLGGCCKADAAAPLDRVATPHVSCSLSLIEL